MTNEKLIEIGQRAVDYFNDTGECLFCDVDREREPGGAPVHQGHCSLAAAPSPEPGTSVVPTEPPIMQAPKEARCGAYGEHGMGPGGLGCPLPLGHYGNHGDLVPDPGTAAVPAAPRCGHTAYRNGENCIEDGCFNAAYQAPPAVMMPARYLGLNGGAVCHGPAPEPVKPPAMCAEWCAKGKCEVKGPHEIHFTRNGDYTWRTPAAGTAPTQAEATRWPANNSGTLVWCGNKEHPQQRHYQANDCLLPRVAGPAMVPPQDCLNSCRLVLGEKDWCGVCRGTRP